MAKIELDARRIVEIVNRDKFRPSLKCDLFIPSYIHSLSVATEFVYDYVFSRFPKDYFETINIAGKHPYEDFRRLKKGNMIKRENPSAAISYNLQYDWTNNDTEWNVLGIDKYLRRNEFERSFFKCPSKKLYIGMDFESMLINYNFKFRVNTRAQQLDLYNRLRKVFRLGCTETIKIDCDYHIDRDLIKELAKSAGYDIDQATGDVLDYWNFVSFLNKYSQMPILRKLRTINNRNEYFIRLRDIPVHLNFQNGLDVDDGVQTGMLSSDFMVEFQIEMIFPSPRTFALYDETYTKNEIEMEDDADTISIMSMKIIDIPEENYKGWPMYGHSDFVPDEEGQLITEIPIEELFKAPVDTKLGSDLDDIIADALGQNVSPDSFIDIRLYSNDITINGNGFIPTTMDWENRKIKVNTGVKSNYLYIAIYIDREYVNNKVIEFTNANNSRVRVSPQNNYEADIREQYTDSHIIETEKPQVTNLPKG